ncbi:MAG: YARHG domain-containing protein [Eubacteriales bacterium]|nr:YARHG domain-containing protein [Eubacteriales bacterium]
MKRKIVKKVMFGMVCASLTISAGALAVMGAEKAVMSQGEGDYILPYSAERYYTMDEISGLSAQELRLARNEIFARYGRKFKAEDLQNYFNGKSWYTPIYDPDSFSEDTVNEIEKANTQLIKQREAQLESGGGSAGSSGSGAGSSAQNASWSGKGFHELADFSQSIQVDLDGDGTGETISIDAMDTNQYSPYDKYRLYVGNSSIDGSAEQISTKYYGVTLGQRNYLVIYEYGPSDDPMCTFYGYSNGEVYKAGEIGAWMDGIQIDEDGSMHCYTNCRILQTDEIDTIWKPGSDGRISQVSQDVYTFKTYNDGRFYRLLQNIEVYDEPSYNSSSYVMTPQGSVQVPYTDGTEWVYVVGASGDGGWYNCGSASSSKWDIFEGLFMAD